MKSLAYKKKNERQAYMIILPAIIGFFVFSIYPIIWVFRYSFFDYDGINATFCGLENFVRAFTRDAIFWKSVVNTFILAYGKLIVEIPLALIIALMISSSLVKFKKIFNIAFYLPRVTGSAVNCLIFTFLFATVNGKINNLLLDMNLISHPVSWLGGKWSAMFVLSLFGLWSGLSYNVLYFMAGVQNIPEDVLEAARVDGATRLQSFFKITLPMLAPVVKVILMLAMVNGMKIMDQVMLITNGGPAGETNVAMLHIYNLYFTSSQTPQYGYAACLGVVMTVIIGIITCIYLKLSKKADMVI